MVLPLAEIGELFSKLNTQSITVMIVMGACVLVAITALIAHALQRAAQSDHRTRLAALLVQRGLPTAEIERILRAAQSKGDDAEAVASDDPEVQLVKILTGNHYDGDDVQLILEAARANGPIDAPTIAIAKAMSESWIEAKEIAEVIRKRHTRDPKLAITA